MTIRNPLPEGRWPWRRAYVYALTFALWSLLDAGVGRAATGDLRALCEGLMGLMGLVMVLYLIAPTAQQLVELAAALKLRLRGGR